MISEPTENRNNMKRLYYLFLILIPAIQTMAQELITGRFTACPNQSVSLSVYNGFKREIFETVTTDSFGNFKIKYPANYSGMGYLLFNEQQGFNFILHSVGISITGISADNPDNINFKNSPESTLLYRFLYEHQIRESALGAWKYLEKLYTVEPLLKTQNKAGGIKNEIAILENQSLDFLHKQEAGTYMAWYLPLYKFINDMRVSIRNYPERISSHISQFRNTDLSNPMFYNSGLFPELLQEHFFMLENMGVPLDSVYSEMNKSIDYIISSLIDKNPELLDQTSLFLFNLFEQRSLFTPAEHLSLEMLNQNSCSVSPKNSNRFESYRKMKIGNKAPDIVLGPGIDKSDNETEQNNQVEYLSGIPHKYKLLVFFASWCPNCQQELAKLAAMYPKLKESDVEFVFIWLDKNTADFKGYAKALPWINYCDYQEWNSKPVIDYHVFATPTMYLLGENLVIESKVINAEHLDALLKQMANK